MEQRQRPPPLVLPSHFESVKSHLAPSTRRAVRTSKNTLAFGSSPFLNGSPRAAYIAAYGYRFRVRSWNYLIPAVMPQTLGQMYLVCGWLESIFYGVNCMLFGFCIQVLTSSTTSSRRVLAATIIQFSLSTAHVIVTLVLLLQAYSPGVDADVYYGNPGGSMAFIVGFYIYIINTFVQELLLIWRLYGLWERRFSICVVPLIFWAAHVCAATIAVSSFIPTTATAGAHNVLTFGLTGWGLETATNLTANFGIAYSLWRAERRTALLGNQRHMNYQSIMLLVVECGALITTCTVIMFGLFASGHEAGIVGVGIATQIATVSPLLIVVRVGLAQARSRPSGRSISTFPLEVNMLRIQNTPSDCTPQETPKPEDSFLRDVGRDKA